MPWYPFALEISHFHPATDTRMLVEIIGEQIIHRRDVVGVTLDCKWRWPASGAATARLTPAMTQH